MPVHVHVGAAGHLDRAHNLLMEGRKGMGFGLQCGLGFEIGLGWSVAAEVASNCPAGSQQFTAAARLQFKPHSQPGGQGGQRCREIPKPPSGRTSAGRPSSGSFCRVYSRGMM